MSASKRVMASMGITVNLGNYQSVRIDASSEEDVPGGERDSAKVAAVYERLWTEVEDQIAARRSEAKALAEGVAMRKDAQAAGGTAYFKGKGNDADDLPPDVR